MLLSYSRDPGGEIFPLREGRNTIGSGDTKEGDPCDILIPDDRKMSGFHAIILYRRGRYFISDQISTNGTFVNNEEVLDRSELSNYALLQLGRTEFTFIKAEEKVAVDIEEPMAGMDDQDMTHGRARQTKRSGPPQG